MPVRRLSSALMILFAVSLLGCADHVALTDPELDVHRAALLLGEEPADALGVIDIRETLSGSGDVVIVGQIGGVANPWTKNEASFVIVDATFLMDVDDHDHHHDGDCEGCPYCSKKKQNEVEAMALIELVDPAGQVIACDARRLFDLRESQTVVAKGRATVDEFGNLIVAANGLYIRR